MEKVFVIHGCTDNPEDKTYDQHWMPWLKERLIEQRIEAYVPLMPEPWEPNYEAYKKTFDAYPVDEQSILIGHSCGTKFLTRWLADTQQKIAKLILVAPWCMAEEGDSVGKEEFYSSPIDKSIKDSVGEIVIFTSDNEEEIGKQSAQIFNEKLGGIVIELLGRGHYTEEDMGTVEFPELLETILRKS